MHPKFKEQIELWGENSVEIHTEKLIMDVSDELKILFHYFSSNYSSLGCVEIPVSTFIVKINEFLTCSPSGDDKIADYAIFSIIDGVYNWDRKVIMEETLPF